MRELPAVLMRTKAWLMSGGLVVLVSALSGPSRNPFVADSETLKDGGLDSYSLLLVSRNLMKARYFSEGDGADPDQGTGERRGHD